jgi:site-specific recombinase
VKSFVSFVVAAMGIVMLKTLLRAWRRYQVRRELALVNSLIKAPVQRYSAMDEALRERTAKRRLAAESIRRRSQSVDSGAPVSDTLRIVGRK